MVTLKAELYADQFVKLFENSQWKVSRGTAALMGSPKYGIYIGVAKQPDSAVDAVLSAFKKAGIRFTSVVAKHFTADGITIDVMLKENR
jgi:hypothetical protein